MDSGFNPNFNNANNIFSNAFNQQNIVTSNNNQGAITQTSNIFLISSRTIVGGIREML